MKQNKYISLALLFIFSFVLVHNVVPHYHHDKKEQDHHNNSDEPIGLFSHSANILAFTEFIFSSGNSFQKAQYASQFLFINDCVIKPTITSIKKKPPNFISVIPIGLFCDTHSLRGPPVFSV